MKKLVKKKPSKILLLSAALIIITLIIGTIFIYMPFLNKAKSLRSGILHERDRNVLAGAIKASTRHIKVYERRIPRVKSISWLLNEVSDMATQEQIELSSIKPGPPEVLGLYTKMYVTMDTISTYHQLGRFISMVESSDKFLRVEKINIRRLGLDKGFDKDATKFKAFDVKSHIVISTVVFNQ